MKPKVCCHPLLLYREVYLVSYSHKTPVKTEKTSYSSMATLVATVTRKLASNTTIQRSLFIFLNLDVDEHPLHVGMLVQCS